MDKKMQETTLDTFDETLNEGIIGGLAGIAHQLIEDNPRKTVKELLRIGFEDGKYPIEDTGVIAPLVTMMCNDGVIIRPTKRRCTITGRPAMVHELAPEAWRQQLQQLRRQSNGPFVRNRIETPSKSRKDIIHTTIEWTDGSVSCTCDRLYNRPSNKRCHHALGMIQAMTGQTPKEAELEKHLKEAKEIIEELIEYVGNPTLSAVQEAETFLEENK